MKWLALFALCIAFASAVTSLTSSDFDTQVSDGRVWFVKFFAPWCGHCKRLAPTWEELSTKYDGSSNVGIAHVDCTKEKALCSKHGVRGYPTLNVFASGPSSAEKYQGGRDMASLSSFIESKAARDEL